MSEIHQEWFTTFDPLQIELRETRQVGVQAFQVATIERIVPVLVWSLPVFGMPGAALMFRNPDTLTSPRRAFRSPNGGFYMTSSVTWDYLRFWRQLLLVRHCDWTDEFLFQNVMELVCTRKHGTFTDRSGGDFDRLLSSIRGGYRTIEQVMSLSVPDWLVDRMLAMWRTPGIVPVPQVLVRELQAGTLPWREEVRKLGVQPLVQTLEAERLWEQIREVFEPLIPGLRSAACCACELADVRHPILCLVQAQVMKDYGAHVVAALALVRAKRYLAETIYRAAVLQECDPWVFAKHLEDEEQQLLRRLAPWVARRSLRGKEVTPKMIANTLSMLKELEERFLHESRPGVRLQILLDSLEEPEEQKEQEQS